MMPGITWSISAGAILLFALFYFFDGSGLVSALVPAALAHELGHFLALRFCSCRVTRVSVSVTGIELDYAPQVEGLRAAVCFFSGPLAGGLYASAVFALGGDFWRMSGAVSALLSAFNLLPILPLDGGRIVSVLLPDRLTRLLSLLAALILLTGGVALALRYGSFMLLYMGVWLTLCNLRELPGLRRAR